MPDVKSDGALPVLRSPKTIGLSVLRILFSFAGKLRYWRNRSPSYSLEYSIAKVLRIVTLENENVISFYRDFSSVDVLLGDCFRALLAFCANLASLEK